MKVSQSKLKNWRKCHKLYEYKYIQKIERKVKATPLFAGDIIHKCLELWYIGKSFDHLLEDARKKWNRLFDEEKVDEENIPDMIDSVVTRYIEYYFNDNLEPLEVEKEILVPLVPEEDIWLEGKIDLIATDVNSKRKQELWLVEHKSANKIPDEGVRMSDIQSVIYFWALVELGYDTPKGIIWDYLRKKQPSVPQKLKSGELSKNKKIDTTPDVFMQAILDNNLDPEDYHDILEKLEGRQDTFFRRIKLPFSKYMVDQVVEEAKATAIEIKKMAGVLTDRNLTYECDRCEYFSLCQAELRGQDSEYIKKKQFQTKKERPSGKEKESKARRSKRKNPVRKRTTSSAKRTVLRKKRNRKDNNK